MIIAIILLAILFLFISVIGYGFILMGRNLWEDWSDEDLKNREWMKEHTK